jgi:hypothetical protein
MWHPQSSLRPIVIPYDDRLFVIARFVGSSGRGLGAMPTPDFVPSSESRRSDLYSSTALGRALDEHSERDSAPT